MNTRKLTFFMFFGAVVTFGSSMSFNNTLRCYAQEKTDVSNAVKSSGIEWQPSFSKGLEIAKKAKKPIMADFYADWCGWCKKLDKTTYQDKNVIELSKKFVCIKVDTDQDQATSSKYGVKGLPTIVFLSPKGDVTNQIVGYRDGAYFATVMSGEVNKNSPKK